MIASLGKLTLYLTFFLALYSLFSYLIGINRRDARLIKSAQNGVYGLLILIILASGFLTYSLINHDFSIKYVYDYTSSDLPLFYAVSAFWAGQEGSLLLWGLVLSIFAALLIYQNRRDYDIIYVYVSFIVLIVQTFFIFLMTFVTNPFTTIPAGQADGMGLNPLLQNPGMVIHPPTTYIGYIGFTIPFAYAMASLYLRRRDNWWIKKSRRWTIFAWLFLTIGNIVGAMWAYVELGWGGYWGWDPVENASLMPWLVSTAYLHSVMIQERRNMLKGWNIFLIVLTFELTIFGTFLVRSGVISSVHAFGESTLGSYLLAFIGISSLAVISVVFDKSNLLRSENEFDAILSRESSFLLNNLVLVGMMFAVLWGTLFPIISEAITGTKISVKAPFFNQVISPLGYVLLILIGICPLISWKKATWSNFSRNFIYPFLAGLIAAIVAYIYQVRLTGSLIIIFGAFFVSTTILIEIYRGARTRVVLKGENIITGVYSIFKRQKRRYGGYIVHLGVVIIFVGIMASNAFQQSVEKNIKVGEQINIKKYRIEAAEIFQGKKRNAQLEGVRLKVYKNNKYVGEILPTKAFYPNSDQPATEVAIRSSYQEDLYAIFAGLSENDLISLKIVVNPMVSWIWAGAWVILGGAIITLLEKPRPKEVTA